jgi:hypothetical protein
VVGNEGAEGAEPKELTICMHVFINSGLFVWLILCVPFYVPGRLARDRKACMASLLAPSLVRAWGEDAGPESARSNAQGKANK